MDLFTILGKDQGNLILSKISGLAKKIIENYALEQSSQSQFWIRAIQAPLAII